jgi:hypothetical protein
MYPGLTSNLEIFISICKFKKILNGGRFIVAYFHLQELIGQLFFLSRNSLCIHFCF